MEPERYARSIEGKPSEEWQSVEEHLRNVAESARFFAQKFGAGEWGYCAGLWHDMGKYSPEFQAKLLSGDENARVDHSTAGAQFAAGKFRDEGKLLAYVIAGHHAGLPNGSSTGESDLAQRLQKKVPDYSACPEAVRQCSDLPQPPFAMQRKRFGFQRAFFTRMLFSCLVDADRLDAERCTDEEKHLQRKGYPSITELHERLDKNLEHLLRTSPETELNFKRTRILGECRSAAGEEAGLFSLTVPTGGGKTLSSLAFALEHAQKHGMERVIYALPYTSIIEQNADVFRRFLGTEAVLEHHSNFTPREEDTRSGPAAENWDAPLIVTTNVQFFESLFSSKPSRCRKIHNLARSVIILDEAQMLPVPLLKPCLETLRELSSAYGSTIVLCTATQPAIVRNAQFPEGLEGVREIVSDPVDLYRSFKRVRTERLGPVDDVALAADLATHRRVLCIVNTRAHARNLFELTCRQADAVHLSALMCPAHRSEVISRIKHDLAQGNPCRVVSTQLIEAGVDIDFPVVYRASAGIDSLAQAAGRCNREGRIPEGGVMRLFRPETPPPPGQLRRSAEVADIVLEGHDDPLSPEAVHDYFRRLYWMSGSGLDAYSILQDMAEGAASGDIPFKRVDEKFRMIEDGTETVVIPWDANAEKLVKELRYTEYPRSVGRRLQRYTVQVHPVVALRLEEAGSVERIRDAFLVLANMDIYRPDVGLCLDDPAFRKVENMIV